MGSLRILAMMAVTAIAAGQGLTGEITGKVRVTTKLTRKRVSIPQIYDRNSAIEPGQGQGGTVPDELRRVVIYLDGAGLPAHPRKAVIEQRQRRFEPEIVVAPAGSTVSFPNFDPIFHNVFSLSKAKAFDLGNYASGQSRSVTFRGAGVVQLLCHLHPNMSGAVVVTPNDWYTQPGEQGGFALADVPVGKHTLVAWHKSAGQFRRSVEVTAGRPAVVDFEIPLTEFAKREAPR